MKTLEEVAGQGRAFAMGPFGSNIKTENFVESGVPVIQGRNLSGTRLDEENFVFVTEEKADELSSSLVSSGDIVITHRGTLGQVVMIPRASRHPRYVISQSQMKVTVDEARMSPEFVTYWLQSSLGQAELLAYASQTGVPAIAQPLASLRKMKVVCPPLHEQRAIAGVLGALDDKIESNRRILETATRLIAAEFQWIVDSVDDEPYGVRLEVQMGAPFKGEHFSEVGQGRPLIRIRDLKTFTSQVWTTENRADETVITPGDILVGMDAEFRSTIWLGDVGVLNQRMCRFVGKKGVSRSFAWLAIQPELEYCERAKSGTTVIHLNKSDIDRFRVPSLSDEQHVELSIVTEPIFDRLVVAGREITSLSSLRDALLPELLSGRLRIRDAEKVVEEVV